MFQRFDSNKNQKLNLDETMGAFPVFKKTIAEIGKQDPESALLRSVFSYIVKYGRIPNQSDPSDVAQLLFWHLAPFKTINGNRLSLYKVIAMLATTAPTP